MTQPEAKVLEGRLSRIWEPKNEFATRWFDADHTQGQIMIDGCVQVLIRPWGFLLDNDGDHDSSEGQLYCDRKTGEIDLPCLGCGLNCIYCQFAAEWLPLFRRNCWLSGAQIEATMHEIMEWAKDGERMGLERDYLERLVTR